MTGKSGVIQMKKYEILIIAKNTDGIIARIMSLFNRRGYHALKMTAGVTNKQGYTRLTLTVEGDDKILDQIQKQVYKITDVVKVKIFPKENVIRRELMLLKVMGIATKSEQSLKALKYLVSRKHFLKILLLGFPRSPNKPPLPIIWTRKPPKSMP